MVAPASAVTEFLVLEVRWVLVVPLVTADDSFIKKVRPAFPHATLLAGMETN